MKFCIACGGQLNDDAKFCKYCGTPQPELSQGQEAMTSQLPSTVPQQVTPVPAQQFAQRIRMHLFSK